MVPKDGGICSAVPVPCAVPYRAVTDAGCGFGSGGRLLVVSQ